MDKSLSVLPPNPSLVLRAWMVSPKPPQVGQSWDSHAPGEQEQGQVHDLGDSQAEDSLQGQPVARAVSSLSVGASRDF